MNDPRPDLGDLLHDAVDGVEPADRLAEIRARTGAPARAARPWWYAAGGVVLATAAAAAAFAVVGGPADEGHHHHDDVGTPSDSRLVAAYFIGDTAGGPRLFREFDEVPAGDELQAALQRIQQAPDDPDYRSAFQAGGLASAAIEGDVIEVEITADLPTWTELEEQQLVYTLQAALQQTLPVQLVRDGRPLPGELIERAPMSDVLNLVSISDPAEGEEYDEAFIARGRANSFEGTLVWEIREADRVVAEGFATAGGAIDEWHEWEERIDVSDLPAGTYTFVVLTDDPTAGAEGHGPASDTRTIIVR